MKSCDLIIKGQYVLAMDSQMTMLENGAVAVIGKNICALGKAEKITAEYQTKEIVDAGQSIILPGLINTHTHAAMAYFRGLADDLPLSEWLKKHIWPAEAKYVNPDFVRRSSELAIVEMIKSGTTCFNDMYFFEEITAAVADKSGMRAVLAEGILDFPTPSFATAGDAMRKTVELYERYQQSDLISIALGPHSIYACGETDLIRISGLSKKHNLPIHIHVSETKKEVDECRRKNNKSPVVYLDSIGLLSERVIAAHSIWFDDDDLDIYQEVGVKVSHNPTSNMKLASGIAPLPQMIKRGIIIGLGTDGAASNNTLNLFSEMKICALLHKVSSLDPCVVGAEQAVKFATCDGAKVLGLENIIGSLEPGKRADLIAVNLNQPHLSPLFNPYSHLVYCASGHEVDYSVINGKIIMRNRELMTINENEILTKANKFKK